MSAAKAAWQPHPKPGVQVLPSGLVLQGRAATYHAKQRAQHAAMELATAPILANDIEVV